MIVAYMSLIYYQIGWSMFAAIGVIFLLVPLQATFGILFKRFRKFTAMLSDERIKSLSDMILVSWWSNCMPGKSPLSEK